MKNIYFMQVLTVLSVFILLAVSGCGGGDGGSAIDLGARSGQNSSISVKMNMLNYSEGTSFVSIPAGITGRVNIIVKSVKTKKEVANKTVDFNAGFLTFDNEIPIHDTYSVSIKANLHYRSNDTYEVVWTGVSKEIYLYSNEETAQKTLANEVQIGLKFLTIEFVKLYPAKLVFEPELPLTELVKGTIIPPFKVKVLEQYGNVLPTASGDIKVSLHSGTFKNGMVTKSLSAGIAKFGEISVSELVADGQGQAKLEANYSGVIGYSQPMKAIGAITPNASVTGYLSDATTTPASAPLNSAVSGSNGKGPAYSVKAPMAGKQVFLIADNVEYQTVTDLNGFYKFDIKLSSDMAPVKLTVEGPAGPIVSNMSATKGKTQIVIVKVDASGNVRLQKAVLEGNYSEAQDIGVIEKLVEAEIIKIRSSATGVTGVSGRIVSTVDGSGVPGVSVNIKENGESTVSGPGGVFNLSPAAGLKAGNYNIVAAKLDFIDNAIAVNVTEDDYGFSYDGSLISLNEKPMTPPVLTNLSVSGVTGEINITYSINDPEPTDLCGVEVYYSIDGGLSYFNQASVSGDVSNISSGSGKKIVWHSTSDFLSKQSSIRLKLIPFDRRIQGTPVESDVFEVDNLSLTDNKVPVITSVIASGNSGEIQLSFDLADGDNDSCSIELYYSLDDGASLKRSINIKDIANRLFPGNNLSVVWDSYNDIKTNQKSVKVRLVPNDSKTSGSWGESQVFELNNLINTPPAVSNLKASGIKGDISLTYDIIDLDNNLCTAEVYFSTDGVSFKQALNLTGDTKEIESGTGKKLVWNSRSDIADNFESVIIKVVPSDEYGYGSEAVSDPVPVYNFGFRPHISNLSTSGSDNNITLTYDILDKDGELATVEVYYSTNGGAAFTKAVEISGDTSVVMIAGTLSPAKKIIWNSIKDFKTNESNVKVKLTPSDEAGAGTDAVSLAFAVNNAGFRPVISNFTTIGTSGEITLKYDLVDADSSPCFIEVQYSINNSVFTKTLNLIGETAEIMAGIGKSLIWNSKADIAGTASGVTVKLTAADAGGPGTDTVSLPFAVNNSTAPIASNVITAGNSGNITITYDLADANNDSCSVELYYSTDGGVNYKKSANISGAIANVAPGIGNKLTWNTYGDLGQQNFSGVKVKVVPYDAFIAGTPVESAAFGVSNFIPIVPVFQKAEFTLFNGGPALKMTFDTSVSGSTLDLNKIFINNATLDSFQGSAAPAMRAPSQNGVMRITSPGPDISGNVVTVNLSTISPFQKCFGINGDFISDGLKFLAGNGVKSGTGNEVAVNTQPYKIYPLIEDAMIIYNNATGKFNPKTSILSPDGIQGHIDVIVSSVPPNDTTNPAFSTNPEQSLISWSPDVFTVPGAPYPAGQRVYYRFNSTASVKKSEWADYGPIPDAPALFGSGNIAWSNPRSQVDVKTTRIGSKKSRIKIYENLYSGPTYTYKGETDPTQSISNDGYIPGSYNVGTNVTITENYTPVFTLMTASGVESDYFNGLDIIAPPGGSEEPLYSSRIKHNGSAYQLEMASAGTLAYDARVYIGGLKIGRIAAGAYPAGWVTVYSETSTPGSLNSAFPANISTTPDQPLSFSYVNTDGSESTATSYSDVYYPDNSKIKWSNTGNYGAMITSEQVGSGSDIMKISEKNNGIYSLKGTVTGAGNGFSGKCEADSGSQKISENQIVAYAYVNSAGNESPFIDDGIVPAPPSAAVASNLRLGYNGINYEVKNTGASAVNITSDLGVYAGTTFIGAIDYTKSSSIGASAFPNANSYIMTDSANSLNDPAISVAEDLKFIYIKDGNESDYYNASAQVPPAPSDISLINVQYENPGMNYKLYAYDGSVTIDAGTNAYIGSNIAYFWNAGEIIDGYSANSITANPDGGVLAFTTLANGNESYKSTIGDVPAKPDNTKIKWHNNISKFSIISGTIGQSSDERLKLYEKDGTNYTYISAADLFGPYSAGTFTLGSTPPLINAGKEAAFTIINDDSGNESAVSASAIVPTPPQYAEDLRTVYDSGVYKLKNISEDYDFVIQDGQKLCVYIGTKLAKEITASGSNITIDANDGISTFSITPQASGGVLTFTLSVASSNHESESIGSTYVPEAPEPSSTYYNNATPSISFLPTITSNTDDIINLYENASGDYTYIGSTAPAPSGGFNVETVYNITASPSPITGGNGASCSIINSTGNESAIINIPVPGILDHFDFVLDSPQIDGDVFTGTNTLTAKDGYGDTIITFNASVNNVTITSDPSETITGLGSGNDNIFDQAGDFVNGVCNLTGKLTSDGGLGPHTFTATSGGITATSNSVDINAFLP